jgi:hypothetical protein
MLNIKHDLIVKKKNKAKINNLEKMDLKMITNVMFKESENTFRLKTSSILSKHGQLHSTFALQGLQHFFV